jgi:hypothetical protein
MEALRGEGTRQGLTVEPVTEVALKHRAFGSQQEEELCTSVESLGV